MIAGADFAEEFLEEAQVPAAGRVRLSSYFQKPGDKCPYTYDFGDDWRHQVVPKEIVQLPESFKRRLLDGARAFPPEGCGGTWGYAHCLKALGIIEPEEHDDEEWLAERREWMGDWHPDDFDLDAVKKRSDC